MTVEPVIFLFYMAFAIGMVAFQQTLYLKLCYKEYRNLSLCSDSAWQQQHPAVQSDTSTWILYATITNLVPLVVCIIMLSGYSDKNGIGLALVLPNIGSLIAMGWAIVLTVYIEWDPVLLLVTNFIGGATGYYPTMTMACMTYVIRDPDVSNLGLRMAVIEGLQAFSTALGTMVAGPLIDLPNGLTYAWAVAAGCYMLSILDLTFRVKRLPAPEQQGEEREGRCVALHSCFDLDTIKKYFVVILRRREQSKRLHLYVVLTGAMTSFLAYSGLVNIIFLYLTKEYGQSLTQYSVYVGLGCIAALFGSTVLVRVFTVNYPLSDMSFAVVGSAVTTIYYILLGYADQPGAYWAAPVFNVFLGYVAIGSRLYISHTLESHEQAGGMGFFSLVQSVVGLAASALYNTVYPLSLSVWPGVCCALSAFLSIVTIPMFTLVRCRDIRNGADSPTAEQNQTAGRKTEFYSSYNKASETTRLLS
ncbi:hypothetical protein EB796_001065 [Bugula neritina]|uniref:Uncharacterized protein n=1 Tax=Bugula neritina TaxID=10212 RepID=A0A7J7KR51_BUGNE|nr:hypothetical protein EB796_001065 [Bugula neritina]